ncbi:MAG: lysophospholipid acyltransferase family protein [Casimicrobiaceae bacterium]
MADPLDDETVTMRGAIDLEIGRPDSGDSGFVSGLYDTLAFWLASFCFVLITFGWSLCAAFIVWLLPRRIGTRVGQWGIMVCFRIQVAVMGLTGRIFCDVSELDALRADGGLVIAPNHPSLLDVVLVTSRLSRVTCIMKANLWDNVLLGGGARLARYIRNDSPSGMVKLAVDEIRRGSQLLVFPEGTRTVHRPVNRFKGGFALIAQRAGVPVQTVFIETNSPFLGKGWPVWRRPAMPLCYRVRLGRRFTVSGDVKAFSTMLEAYFENEMRVRSEARSGCAGQEPPGED